jgi:hypothetical protein
MSVFLSPNLPANVVEIGNEISQAKINEINAGTLATQTWVTTGFSPKASPTFTGTVTIPAGASISGYLTTSSASSTYQTISGMSSYLTSVAASNTYQTQAGMSSYLTTSTASSTYQTQANMSSYLTSSTASSTYQPIGSYLTDAPSDGSEYVRKNAAWAIATGGGGGLTDAPNDGQQYARKNLAWEVVTGDGTGLADAPSDGSEYVRKNSTWAVATGGGGGGLTISTLSNSATSTLNATAPTTGQALTFDGTDLAWATVGGGGGGAVWGGITGTVTDQTDLTSYITSLNYLTAIPSKSVYTTYGTLELEPVHKNNIIFLNTFGSMSGCILQIGGGTYTDSDYPVGFEVTVVCDLAVSGSTITPTGSVQINGGGFSVSVTTYVSHLVKVNTNTWFYL